MSTRRGSGATGKPPRQGGCLCFQPLQSIERETKFCLCLESNKVRARCSLAGGLVRTTNKGRPSLAGPPLFQSRPPDAFEIQPLSERPLVGEFRRLRTATRGAPPPRPPQGGRPPLTPFRFAFRSAAFVQPAVKPKCFSALHKLKAELRRPRRGPLRLGHYACSALHHHTLYRLLFDPTREKSHYQLIRNDEYR